MAQLSRPYQIGLAAVAVLAAAWLLLLGGHHSSTSGGTSASAPASPTRTVHAPSAPAPAKAHAQGNARSATGGGSASSIGGLGHAIEKAHGAVSTSQKNAKELASKSAQASTPNSSSPSKADPSASKAAGAGAAAHAKSAPKTSSSSSSATHAAPKTSPSTRGSVRATVAVRQHAVERQLAEGKIAVIFFWNPKGADDRAVNRSLNELPGNLRIAIDRARANAVATFGTITRGVQVYGTPTMLIVNKKGQVTTMTGLQDPSRSNRRSTKQGALAVDSIG